MSEPSLEMTCVLCEQIGEFIVQWNDEGVERMRQHTREIHRQERIHYRMRVTTRAPDHIEPVEHAHDLDLDESRTVRAQPDDRYRTITWRHAAYKPDPQRSDWVDGRWVHQYDEGTPTAQEFFAAVENLGSGRWEHVYDEPYDDIGHLRWVSEPSWRDLAHRYALHLIAIAALAFVITWRKS